MRAAKNWPYSSAPMSCNLCIPSQAQILRDNPTSSLTKAAGVAILWIMRESFGRNSSGMWAWVAAFALRAVGQTEAKAKELRWQTHK